MLNAKIYSNIHRGGGRGAMIPLNFLKILPLSCIFGINKKMDINLNNGPLDFYEKHIMNLYN